MERREDRASPAQPCLTGLVETGGRAHQVHLDFLPLAEQDSDVETPLGDTGPTGTVEESDGLLEVAVHALAAAVQPGQVQTGGGLLTLTGLLQEVRAFGHVLADSFALQVAAGQGVAVRPRALACSSS